MIFAGAGFARMAWELAQARTYRYGFDDVTERWRRIQSECRFGAKLVNWRMSL